MTQLNIAPTPADTAAANNNAAAGAKPVAKWRVADIVALYELPFNDLMFRAQQTHREAAVDQDRRLRRRLRVLSAVGASRHRPAG